MNHNKDSPLSLKISNDQQMKQKPNEHVGVVQQLQVGPMANRDQMANDDLRTMSRA